MADWLETDAKTTKGNQRQKTRPMIKQREKVVH